MRMLAIDCTTQACSLALFANGHLLAARHEVLGRGHAEHLIPFIAAFPERGRADEIRVSLGPGSFTGVRIGLAAARALGLAWGAPVRGFPTLALIAAMAQHQHQHPPRHPGPVTVCMAGGHGEWFVQDFGADGLPERTVASISPETAAANRHHPVIAGNRARELAALAGPGTQFLDILPDTRAAPAIPAGLLTDNLAPIYGRAPDAKRPA